MKKNPPFFASMPPIESNKRLFINDIDFLVFPIIKANPFVF